MVLCLNSVRNVDGKLMTHQKISYSKSLVRIAGYFLLLYSIPMGVGALVVSEVIGIIEEIGHE